MQKINKYIFYNICDKNIDIYSDLINTASDEYNEIINKLKIITTCSDIRIQIHKLIGLVALFIRTNTKIIYLCKLILFINKNETDINLYINYIQMVIDYDKENLCM